MQLKIKCISKPDHITHDTFFKFKGIILGGRVQKKDVFRELEGSCAEGVGGAVPKGKGMSAGKGHIFNYFQRALVCVL